LTATKYPYLKWQWIFYFLRRFFLSSITAKTDRILFSFLRCPIVCLYVLSCVLWCPLRFPNKNDVWFVFTPSCL
jgi:hypothetical protein